MMDHKCMYPAQNSGTLCECHKKLVQFGIPLYICDENDCFGEHEDEIFYERAFRVPDELRVADEITEYLKVEENDLPAVFEQMAEVFPNLGDYEENILSFWILDIMIEGLWSAQNAKMGFKHQKATLKWIAYFFNYIQKENPSRKRLFRHLKTLLFQSETNQNTEEGNQESIKGSSRSHTEKFNSNTGTLSHWTLPLPPSVQRSQPEPDEYVKDKSSEEATSIDEYQTEEGSNSYLSISSVNPSEHSSEKSIADIKVILEILYRIFARGYAFILIQTAFNMMPSLEEIGLPFPLKIPKALAKPDTLNQGKNEKCIRRSTSGKSSDLETEKELIKHNSILPLEVSEEAKEYLKQHSSDRSVMHRNKEDKAKK